ncbi:uncharacterized protein [Chironomus tepperi]|uniref:uncharacterized protein n=1 Tax=Chironomus tepperi TaxID=113505 RepID=UPI00391F2BE2
MSNSLVEVPTESLPILRDAYKINWPEHIVAFSFLDKMIKRFKERPEQREIVKIYSVDGKLEQDATFIAVTSNDGILFATLDLTFERLNIGLRGLNFEEKKIFLCVREIYRDTLIEFIKSQDLKLLFNDSTVMVHKKHEDAINLQYEVPEGLVIRRLSTSNADQINSIWPHRSPGSEKFIEYCIEMNLSVGLYDEATGELLAWCLEHDNANLLALQVDPNHLRKGYATIVTKAITKLIAQERGFDVHTNIIVTNFKSLGLFEKLSFNKIDKNFWIGAVNK